MEQAAPPKAPGAISSPQALSPIAGDRPAGDEREGEREDKSKDGPASIRIDPPPQLFEPQQSFRLLGQWARSGRHTRRRRNRHPGFRPSRRRSGLCPTAAPALRKSGIPAYSLPRRIWLLPHKPALQRLKFARFSGSGRYGNPVAYAIGKTRTQRPSTSKISGSRASIN